MWLFGPKYAKEGVGTNWQSKTFGTTTESTPIPAMNERILVQDDEEPILEIMCSMLTASGYECLKATSPEKAWAILGSETEVDVLLCGLIESSEEELVERITKTFPDIPVVVVSAFDDSSVVGVALRKGAYDFLKKPFGREQLLALVRRALEYRRLKLENRALQAKLAKNKSVQPEEKMTTEERRETLKDLNGAVTNTLGLIEIMQDPEQEVNREAALGKAHEWAERAMKLSQEVFFDAIGLLPSDTRKIALSREERTRGDKPKRGSETSFLPKTHL
jgi:DNA-binding response OmpR family regulator